MVGPRALLLLALLIAGRASALSDQWGPGASSLAECDAALRRLENFTSWACYYQFAFEHRDQVPGVMRAMAQVLARRPRQPYAWLISVALRDLADGGAEASGYRDAQGEFRARGDREGELTAAMAVVSRAAWDADLEVGWKADARALELAREMKDPEAEAWALQGGAELAITGVDYGRAERMLREAQPLLTPRSQWWVRWRVDHTLGRTLSATARPLEAIEAFDRAASLAATHPVWRVMTASFRAEEAVRLASAGALPTAEADRRLEEALALARTDGMVIWFFGGEGTLELLSAALHGASQEGLSVAQRELKWAERRDQPVLKSAALRLLARMTIELDPAHPERARPFAERQGALALELQSAPELALARLSEAHLDWRAKDAPGLQRDAATVLETVDRIRWQQPQGLVRARTSADWAFAYELLAGWELDLAGPAPSGSAVDEPLATMERLRGRVLLDELVRSGVSADAVPGELEERRRKVLSEIGHAQRVLVGTDVSQPERDAARGQLQRAESSLVDLEDAIARAHPAAAPVPVASRQALQVALRGDEALLSFQLWRPAFSLRAPYPVGRSWLVVLTRRDAFAVPVPDAHRIEPEAAMFQQLVRARDGSEREAAQSLGRQLLSAAAARLLPEVRSLIVVPDGPLNGLPLETLELSGQPLGQKYAVSVVPSASLWLRWRRGAASAPGPALALADPQAGSAPGAQRDAARWLESLQLPSLPHAREEASAMVDALGRGGALRLGTEASEHFLKTADLRSWGVLHFATHAVVDETEPDRSALVLAPGDADEDGLLQPREIAQLDLNRKVVVLSACRTASGHLVASEGVYGLVRAFFRAGAVAVLASPWPLGDADAQQLIDELAVRLGEGQTLGNALAGAKRARREAGAPTRVWAGLQLYGDGSVVPHPVPSRARAVLVLLAAALALGALLARAFGRRGCRTAGPGAPEPSPPVGGPSA